MTFFRSFFLNFWAVFFINRVVPGIEVGFFQQVPNIGASLLFSAIVGFLNASVFPALFILELNPSVLKIAILTFIISCASFIAIAIIPFGVQAVSLGGIVTATLICWAIAYVTNYLEWRKNRPSS